MRICDILGVDLKTIPQDQLEEICRTGRLAREAEAAPKTRSARSAKPKGESASSLAIFDEDDL